MTRHISLLQLGVGRIGAEVADIIVRQAPHWQQEYNIAVRYAAIADSTAFLPMRSAESSVAGIETPFGMPLDVSAHRAARAEGQRFAGMSAAIPLDEWRTVLAGALESARDPHNLVVLDCASGLGTTPILLATRAAGGHAVLANKDPLAGSQSQYAALQRSPHGGTLRASATVGAGLPILAAIERVVAGGDRLRSLDALTSGSLGFLCDQLSSGTPFDVAVRTAEERGYTEPDPRQDLSGYDVARKLLILARTAGWQAELTHVQNESLVPPGAEMLSPDTFRSTISDYGSFLADRVRQVRAAGRVLRYVGRIAGNGALSARLIDLPPEDPLARGSGPENVFVLRTDRYDTYPLTIAGPGAGVAVTAGAVVADLLRALEVL